MIMYISIQWGYFRNGWTTCKRAQEFLDANSVSVEKRINASKEKIPAEAAWELIRGATKVTVAKGKKLLEWNPATDNPEEILASVMGPSGNLRAPTWRIDDEFLVGFHEEYYQQRFRWINRIVKRQLWLKDFRKDLRHVRTFADRHPWGWRSFWSRTTDLAQVTSACQRTSCHIRTLRRYAC